MEQHLLELGQVIQTHELKHCIGQWCVIHRQQPGPWSSWPRYWRSDRRIVERICEHGVGHPAAESYQWYEDLIHGCDGCPCSPQAGIAHPVKAIESGQITKVTESNFESTDLQKRILDLIIDLWPHENGATVTLTSANWDRLRKVLLETLGAIKE